MLTVSLDCLSSSSIWFTQCWQCLWIVYLYPVSCVPYVDSVSRLFIVIQYLVYPMLTVSLDCLSSSCILCTLCWQCLSIVYRHPVSCLPNVDSVSGLFIFILYLVYPMLTVSLDCLSSSSILCTQCWQCLWIVCLHSVTCVHTVEIVSPLFVFILYLVYPVLTLSLDCLSSSCILCAQCWYCLSIVCLHPVSCFPNVDSVSRWFVLILYLVSPMLTVSLDCLSSSCILFPQCWVSLDCLFSSCILFPQCWHCLSIVCLHPVSCVPYVDIVSRLFVFILYLMCPMLTVFLDCLSSSCILCAQCWQCLSILLCFLTFIICLSTTQWCSTCLDYMSSMKCVLLEAELLILREHVGLPSVFGGIRVAHLLSFCVVLCRFVLFVFVLCLMCPLLPVSLDCPFLIAPSVFSNVHCTYLKVAVLFLYITHIFIHHSIN
jgi:hypothetical protein